MKFSAKRYEWYFYAKVRLIENYVIVKTGFLLIRNQFCFEMPCLCIYYIGGGSQNGGFEFKKFAACSNWGISSHFPPFFSISNKSCGIWNTFFSSICFIAIYIFLLLKYITKSKYIVVFILTIKELRINVMKWPINKMLMLITAKSCTNILISFSDFLH